MNLKKYNPFEQVPGFQVRDIIANVNRIYLLRMNLAVQYVKDLQSNSLFIGEKSEPRSLDSPGLTF